MRRQDYLNTLPEPIGQLAKYRMGKKGKLNDYAKGADWYAFIIPFTWPDDEYAMWSSVCRGKDLLPFIQLAQDKLSDERRKEKNIGYRIIKKLTPSWM